MNTSKSYRNRLIQTVALNVLLLFWISTVKSSDPQMIVVGCSRKIIESYPEAPSKPVLRLLDESRSMAIGTDKRFTEERVGTKCSGMESGLRIKTY